MMSEAACASARNSGDAIAPGRPREIRRSETPWMPERTIAMPNDVPVGKRHAEGAAGNIGVGSQDVNGLPRRLEERKAVGETPPAVSGSQAIWSHHPRHAARASRSFCAWQPRQREA